MTATRRSRLAGDEAAKRNWDHSESVAHVNSIPQPVHDARGRVVGKVIGDVLKKRVIASRHQLRHPPAWAFDICSLEEAHAAGARFVELHDKETGEIWKAALMTIWSNGFELDRGCGRQVALALHFWTQGDVEVAEQLPLFPNKKEAV